MKLIDKLNGDKQLLKKFSTMMYFMNKEIDNDFSEFLDFCDLTIEEWDIFASWLHNNGLKTYN